jgi:hypothetical protein
MKFEHENLNKNMIKTQIIKLRIKWIIPTMYRITWKKLFFIQIFCMVSPNFPNNLKSYEHRCFWTELYSPNSNAGVVSTYSECQQMVRAMQRMLKMSRDHEKIMATTKNIRKIFRFFFPMQFKRKGQWWSNLITQRLQVSQCLLFVFGILQW